MISRCAPLSDKAPWERPCVTRPQYRLDQIAPAKPARLTLRARRTLRAWWTSRGRLTLRARL